MTLRWRIALILAGVAFGVSVAASAVAYLDTSTQLRSAIDETLRSRAAAVDSNVPNRGGRGPGDGQGPDAGDCPDPGSFQPAAAAQLVSAAGAVTSCIAGAPALPATAAELRIDSTVLSTVTISGQSYRLLTTPWHDGGVLQIARSLAETDSVLSKLRLRLILLVVAATVVPAVLGWVIATRLTRPLARLRDTAEHIASTRDLSRPVDIAAGSGEVRTLSASFATMVAALGQSQDQQRRLVSDASHEMRTPLTSLRSNVELLGRIERLEPAERAEVVDDVLEDIDELAQLMTELVDLASDTSTPEPREQVELPDLVTSVVARVARRTRRAITVDLRNAAEVHVVPRQIERAVSNLLDNAVKYSPAGSPIGVTVDGGRVTVRDHGAGIAPDDLRRIFDRFYRATEVRTERGTGLGLSIVEEIVRRHAGQVFAANSSDGGAVVGFELPISSL